MTDNKVESKEVAIEVAHKVCPDCKQSLELSSDNFYKMGAGRRYFSTRCKACENARRATKYVKKTHHLTKLETHPEMKDRIQEGLSNGLSISHMARVEGIAPLTITKAIKAGILTRSE